MKKIITLSTIAVVILTVLFSVLPTSTAQAATHADVTITVKNRTAGAVTITLSNEDSGSFTFTFDETGMYEVTVPEGKYEYYAVTPCGNESGQFNLNISKQLSFSCKDGREVTLSKSCQKVLWVAGGLDWFELNPEWWPELLNNPMYDEFGAEMRCYDPSLESVFTNYGGPN